LDRGFVCEEARRYAALWNGESKTLKSEGFADVNV
jgi:hypothetical protein